MRIFVVISSCLRVERKVTYTKHTQIGLVSVYTCEPVEGIDEHQNGVLQLPMVLIVRLKSTVNADLAEGS